MWEGVVGHQNYVALKSQQSKYGSELVKYLANNFSGFDKL